MAEKTAKEKSTSNGSEEQTSTIFTHKARCRDCYRCVRVCPVKAIRLHGGQATVVAERCIGCGRCIRECPQGAKMFRRDAERVRRWIADGEKVAVSVAPSFAGLFSGWERRRFASALRRLGFSQVEETAVGAWSVAHGTADEARAPSSPEEKPAALTSPVICSACPAVVRFVEIYRPDQAHLLARPVSPMLAHGRMLKAEGRVDRVVFVGPCVAKKDEAESGDGAVDAVLTFVELKEWMEQAGVDLSQLEESGFDCDPDGASAARLFALEGGLARTAGLNTDMLDEHLLAISGFDELVAALDGLRSDPEPIVLEPLLCSGGCINGPVVPAGSPSLLVRRRRLLAWAANAPSANESARAKPKDAPVSLLRAVPGPAAGRDEPPSEEAIRRVLAEEGKTAPEDRLDCGACGYDTCEDKAIAFLRGMAEREMCIPRMRRLAEQRTDRVIETSPNGIVILDERLRILHMNPAFRRFFVCSDAVLGKPISYLMDPAPFEQVKDHRTDKVELTARHESYQLVCRQIIYALPEESQVVGLFVNLTDMQANEERLEQLRSQTREQARELLEHQIDMAQKMAMFLGENTALGESLVHQLLQLAGAEDPAADPADAAIAGRAKRDDGGRGRGGGRDPGSTGSGGRYV